jgi:hypothetical protein
VGSLAISYTSAAGTAYAVEVSRFSGGDLPRSYLQQTKLDFTAQGAAVMGGPVRRQRMLWAATAFLEPEQAATLDALYRAWDADRAAGLAAVLSVTDTTGPGASITASALFTTAPGYSRAGMEWLGSFGLTEV